MSLKTKVLTGLAKGAAKIAAGARVIGNPATKTGQYVAAAEKGIYAAELGVTGATAMFLHQNIKHQRMASTANTRVRRIGERASRPSKSSLGSTTGF